MLERGGRCQDLMIFPAKEFHISEKVTRNGGKHAMERASTSPGGGRLLKMHIMFVYLF